MNDQEAPERLPESVDADKIEAKFAKGLLTVRLPKKAEAKKPEKKIEVKATTLNLRQGVARIVLDGYASL